MRRTHTAGATMNWQQELLEQASAAAKAVKPKPAGKVRGGVL